MKTQLVDKALRKLIRQEIQAQSKSMSQEFKTSFKESVNERVSSPFSQHLKDAQDEIEYMISEHPGAEEEGVYDKPKQAIKFLQVAQKALDKIT